MPTLSFVHWLVVLSTIISLSGAYAYIRDTISGKTKPNRISWAMWALAPLIGTAAALAADADIWATIRVFLSGLIPLLVFIASFVNKKSYWKLTAFDCACGALSLLALVVWAIVDSPRIAIILAAVGDGFALVPTLRKAWKHPETETGLTYLASLISCLLVLPSIPEWNIENCTFQIYLLIANTLLLFAVYRARIGLGASRGQD